MQPSKYSIDNFSIYADWGQRDEEYNMTMNYQITFG